MAPEPANIPLAEAAAAAAAVEAQRAGAVEAVTEGIHARLGDELEPFGAAGRADCRDDLHSHIDYLVGALVAGTPLPFGDYLVWLRDLLEARQVPTGSVPLSATLLAEYLRERLAPEQYAPVEVVIQGGHDALGADTDPVTPFRAPAEAGTEHPSAEALSNTLVTGDQGGAREIVDAAQLDYLPLAVGLIQPALYRVGERWQAREISVAQEHLATALAQRLLAQAFTRVPWTPAEGPGALFACVPSNHHAVGLRMVADAFELEGWSVEFLGADTPADDLLERIDQTRPELVGLSVSMVRQLPRLKDLVDRIRARFADEGPRIVAGGLGLVRVPGVADRLGLDGWYPTAQAAIQGHE